MRKILSVFMLLLLLAMAAVAAASPTLVTDRAGLLTSDEVYSLQIRLESLSDELGMDVAVLTVNSLEGRSASAYADDYYDANGYRYDGILLLVAMAERQWYITTSGDGMSRITNAEVDRIGDAFVEYLSSGDYGEAFGSYAENVAYYASAELASRQTDRSHTLQGWLICVAIGLVVGLITVLIMKAQLKSVRHQNSASDYMVGGSFRLTQSNELFLFRNVSKVARSQNSGGHTGSSGRSHGGGGGSF